MFTRFQPWAPKRLVKWALGFTECVTYVDINAPGDNKSVSLTTLNVSLMQTSMPPGDNKSVTLTTLNVSLMQTSMPPGDNKSVTLTTLNVSLMQTSMPPGDNKSVSLTTLNVSLMQTSMPPGDNKSVSLTTFLFPWSESTTSFVNVKKIHQLLGSEVTLDIDKHS